MKKYLFFLLKLAFTALIFYLFVFRNSGDLLAVVRQAEPLYMILGFLALALQVVFTTLRWKLLLDGLKIRFSFAELFSLTMQGMFFTLFIPGGAVGGDVVKAGILAKRSHDGEKFNGVFSILMDRILGLVTLFSMSLILSAVFFRRLELLPEFMRMVVYGLIALCVCGLAGTACLFAHDFFLKPVFMQKLLAQGDKFTKNAFSNAIAAVKLFRRNYPYLLKSFLLSLLVVTPLLLISLTLQMKAASGGHMPGLASCALASALGNVASAIPVTPGGLGTRDSVTKALLENGGADAGGAAAAPLLYTAGMLILTLCGGLFFLFDGKLRESLSKST